MYLPRLTKVVTSLLLLTSPPTAVSCVNLSPVEVGLRILSIPFHLNFGLNCAEPIEKPHGLMVERILAGGGQEVIVLQWMVRKKGKLC